MEAHEAPGFALERVRAAESLFEVEAPHLVPAVAFDLLVVESMFGGQICRVCRLATAEARERFLREGEIDRGY